MLRTAVVLFHLVSLCLATVGAFGQCDQDRHNTNLQASWISCDVAVCPNPAREDGHWIMYELDETRSINSIQLWNLNHPDHLSSGVRTVAIDYQLEGAWVTYGEFEVSMATGSAFYAGEMLPFESAFVAEKILFNVIENHGGDCHGFAEVRLGTQDATMTSLDLIASDQAHLQIIPNPFETVTQVSVERLQSQSVQYELVTGLGQIVEARKLYPLEGRLTFDIVGQSLASGVYYVKITDGQRIISKALIR